MNNKNRFDWINAKSLLIAVLAVIVLIFSFMGLYIWVEPEHESEKNAEKTEIVIETAEGQRYIFDSGTSKITIKETIDEKPLVDVYSSFLVAFISVLATFVVVANFANAREVSKAADKAEKADELIKRSASVLNRLEKFDNLYRKNSGDINKLSFKIDDWQQKMDDLLNRDKVNTDLIYTMNKNTQGDEDDLKIRETIIDFVGGDLINPLAVFREYANTKPVAAYALALYYNFGWYDVGIDMVEAVKWYKKAAEGGIVSAQFNLGLCYMKGDGVTKDRKEAVRWYTEAANNGNASAQYYLGQCYRSGTVVKINKEEAVKWFTKAANKGHTKAQVELAMCYKNGDGIGVDLKEAVKWFTKAAERSHSVAQYNLGLCYANGEGVENRDMKEAAKWYTKSAKQGNAIAQNALGYYCYYKGEGVNQSYEKAFEWCSKSSFQYCKLAYCSLGEFYEKGCGVEKDLEIAIEFYIKAAKKDVEPAKRALIRLGVQWKNE